MYNELFKNWYYPKEYKVKILCICLNFIMGRHKRLRLAFSI